MKRWKKCPLLALLLVSGIVMEGIALANYNGIYADYHGAGTAPAVASVFMAAKDHIYPWSREEALQEPGDKEETPVPQEQPSESVSESGAADSPESGAVSGNEAGSVSGGVSENDMPGSVSGNETESISGNEAGDGQTPGSAEPENGEGQTYGFTQVGEDYFDDAVFIGDSRTQGLFEYGGLENRATFYCKTSLTVYDLFEKGKPFIKEGDEKLTLEEALTRHQFGKVYLMIGINEMGTGTAESFFESYAKAVLEIRRLQPDAIIFVQGIMRVAGDKNASDPIFNNTNINIRNVEIQTLANNRDIFYIDVNEAVCDENGNLHADWTFDQIHLKAKYYQVWKEFLMAHGVVR